MDTKRFNNPEYKKQIRAVRNYRRQVQQAPETGMEKALYRIGLGSLLSQIIAVLVVALLVYLIYFAKFLKIDQIQITGADQQASAEIQQNFQDYKKNYRALIFPEKNILFFNENGFKNYLIARNYKVADVNKISKRLLNHIYIEINQRAPSNILQAGGNSYILNTDSTIGAVLTPEQLASMQYPVIKDTAEEGVNSGDKFFDKDKNAFFQSISKDIEKKLMLPIESYEVPGKASDQLVINLQKGFKVYFSDTTDPEVFFQRFYTLWLQLTPDQQNKLAYFDFRFDTNAYSCYKGDPCATETAPATETPPIN